MRREHMRFLGHLPEIRLTLGEVRLLLPRQWKPLSRGQITFAEIDDFATVVVGDLEFVKLQDGIPPQN